MYIHVPVCDFCLCITYVQAAIRRRDALQLDEERSGIDRDKKKRHHKEVHVHV